MSLVPPNSPFGIFTRRTYTGSPHSQVSVGTGYLCGRLVYLKINVVQPYTGNVASRYTLKLGQYGYGLVNADKSGKGTNFIINLRNAGERIITPDGVTGAKPGDANLEDLTGGVWLPGRLDIFLGNDAGPINISGEPDSVRPIVVVEALTEQEF